jgi:hypothetical protein
MTEKTVINIDDVPLVIAAMASSSRSNGVVSGCWSGSMA